MNTQSNKQRYNSPRIEHIPLDNEISLILVSGDPGEPNGNNSIMTPAYFNTNPFDTLNA